MFHANRYTYRNKLHYEFHQLLCDEAEKRNERPTTWAAVELAAMWDRVNQERKNLGKHPLTLDDVKKVESMALGHSDYGTKFALYCTELVEETP